jgi:hypothetical protein
VVVLYLSIGEPGAPVINTANIHARLYNIKMPLFMTIADVLGIVFTLLLVILHLALAFC